VANKQKLDAIKRHIAVLLKRKSYMVPHGPEYPTKWWIDGVIDPRSGQPFTYPGAWDFIAERLKERGTTIEEIPLDKPQGKKAYVLRERTKDGIIYIKVHFGIGKEDIIMGRSFHYDEEQ
jgi:hypothetical protein